MGKLDALETRIEKIEKHLGFSNRYDYRIDFEVIANRDEVQEIFEDLTQIVRTKYGEFYKASGYRPER